MAQCRQCGTHQTMAMKFCPRCGTKFEYDLVQSSTASYKVVILGPGSVGKSSIAIQYVYRQFQSIYDPTIEDKYSKVVDHKDIIVRMEIIDTAGQETFHCMREMYFKSGNAFAVVYSVIAEDSFDDAKKIFYDLDQARGGDGEFPPVVLVGNKIDLVKKRQVTTKTGQAVATQWGVRFIETSAKEDVGVTDIFTMIIDEIWRVHGVPVEERKKRGCVLF